MGILVKELTPGFGAAVRGLDLSRPLDDASFDQVLDAFHQYAVLVFPDQKLNDEQQIAFSLRFGPLETSISTIRADRQRRLSRPEVSDISNVDENNQLLTAEDERALYNAGNQMWHSDSSFKRVPALASLLSAREVPPEGGETEFADMRAAWDALPEERRRDLDGLVVEHSLIYSRSLIGYRHFTDAERAALPPVKQALVRTHPATGRKSLYLGSHASHIIGRPMEEGRAVLRELLEFATNPRFVYRHGWRVNDLVMWDNRCALHRGRPWDESKYRRVMHRITVAGAGPTVADS
jgi:alpha-ketoglutarate-dependent 2,4-dichlorophenoxyacetate dioxygenase